MQNLQNMTQKELRHALEVKEDYLAMYSHRLPETKKYELTEEIREIRLALKE